MKNLTLLTISLIFCFLSYSQSHDYVFNTFNVLNSLRINANTDLYFKSAHSNSTTYYNLTYDSINRTITCEQDELARFSNEVFIYHYTPEGLLNEININKKDSTSHNFNFHYSNNQLDSITTITSVDEYWVKYIISFVYENGKLTSRKNLGKAFNNNNGIFELLEEATLYEESYYYEDELLTLIMTKDINAFCADYYSKYEIDYNNNGNITEIVFENGCSNQPHNTYTVLKREYLSENTFKEINHVLFTTNDKIEYLFYIDNKGRDTLIESKSEYQHSFSKISYINAMNIYLPPLPDFFYSFYDDFEIISSANNIYKTIKQGASEWETYSENTWWDTQTTVNEFINYKNAFFHIPVKIEDFRNQKNLKIFPNPVSDGFYIEGLQSNSATLKIFDMYGRMHFNEKCGEKEYKNISALKNGIYIITIEDKNGLICKSKIIKK